MTARIRTDVEQTLTLFAREGLIYTCVDEPQGTPSSVPSILAATSPQLALVRMHGRNAARWQRGATSAAQRFGYLYAVDDLRAWAPSFVRLADRVDEVHVLFNNCYADYAVRNARELAVELEHLTAVPAYSLSGSPAPMC
ncbi:MAG TPA: DUF72 domain-containing protein [Kofleriaceae bacterium]|nr:DUF72 domain-containing protein [Kofleriaceae bacterium]